MTREDAGEEVFTKPSSWPLSSGGWDSDGVALSCRSKRTSESVLILVILGGFATIVALITAQRNSLQKASSVTTI